MKNIKINFWLATTGLLIFFIYAFLMSPGEKQAKLINIGVPDDSASYVFRYLIEELGLKGQLSTMLGIYPIKDCCTSTSEWALSTDNLDMAVICPDAAERLIEKDSRYYILGPCRVNSDILISGPSSRVNKIGITQNRWYQETLAHEHLGPDIDVYPMLGNALPFAIQNGRIDGAIMDIANALRLEGKITSLSRGKDHITYVLVVRKDILHEPIFYEFVNLYNQAVQELQDEQSLQIIIEKYAGYSCNGKEASEWIKMNVQYKPLIIPATD
ncbi:MAG: hypothetical protein CVU90_03145 [Firmicutes bacterium HGW-Firmicutes-15]|nr:MAG: hypothetical protein CVU90_03145 [Firmicutes bacterium HGW-Firmicutes-15]